MAVATIRSGEAMEVKPIRNVDKSLLDFFWNLVETAQDVRLNAALGIINLLHSKQKLLAEDSVDATCPELKYSIERLVKGISSYRKAARQGYTLALTEILKLFPSVAVKEVLSLMDKHLPLSNKQEKSQMVIGQLLAYSAIIRSGRLKDDLESLPTVVCQLYLLSSGRYYIQETTYKLMSHLFTEIPEDNFSEHVWPKIKKKLSCGWESCSPDVFWFLLLCLRTFPNTITAKFLLKNWGCKDILSSENFEHLQKIVKQSTGVHPQFSPVCSELLHFVLRKKKVQKFWNAIFDETLFKSDQNEKTYLGFKVIKAALSQADEKLVSSILSPNFLSVLTRCLLSNKHPMNSAATELVKFFGSYVKESTDPQVQIVVLKAFIQPPGTILLEQILNKKEIGVITSNLSPEAVKLFYEMLQCLILQKSSSDEDEEILNQKRCHAFSQIGTLVSHLAIIADTEWRLEVIKFLFLHSFFEIKEATEDLDPKWVPRCGSEIDSLDTSVRESCMHSFNRALDSLNRKTVSNSGSPFDQQVDFLKSLADYAQLLLQSTDKIIPLQPLEKVQDPWNEMMNTVKKLTKHSKKNGKTAEIAAFQIFFLQLGLQLFSDADHIPGILEELQVCYKNSVKRRKDNEGASGDPPWIQVIVDLMLSLISQESHHMRCVVNSVFSLINPFVTQDAMQLILDVINPEKATDDGILIESSEDENDVEFGSGSSSEDDDNEEEDGEGTQKSTENENIDKLKLKLQEALGPAADVSDAESEVLTDSDMTQLDEALSAAFRSQKKAGHLQFNSEQEALMHFRIRCLDLVSIYLKTEPPMSLVLLCVLPVLSAYIYGLHSRHQQPLSQKAHSTLQLLVKTKKFRDCNGVECDEIRKILHHLIDKANRETSAAVGKQLNSLCVYMVLCERKLESSSPETEKKTKKSVEPSCLDQFKTALDAFVNQMRSHLTPLMFVTLMNSCPESAWSFVKPLHDCAFNNNVRLFKRVQCLGLLLSSLRFSKGQKTITCEMWLDVLKTLLPKAVEALCTTLNGESDIKPMYTTELLEIVITILDLSKEKCAEALTVKNKEQLLELLTGLSNAQKKRLTQKGKRSVNKLIRLLGGEVPVAKQSQSKRKVSEEDEMVDNNKNGKKFKPDKNRKVVKKNKLDENDGESKTVEPNKDENHASPNSSESSGDGEMSDR